MNWVPMNVYNGIVTSCNRGQGSHIYSMKKRHRVDLAVLCNPAGDGHGWLGNLGKSFMVEDIDGGMQTLLEVSNGPNGSSHVPAFLAKLWKIVDDPNTNDLICWSEMGNSFLIRNQSKFARELLPLYYKHNNMASFVRQLNMYGFHKVVSVEQGGLRTDKDEMEFAHPFFLRGSESTLELIKRKIPAAKLDESRGSRPDSMNKVLQDVRQMKGRQDSMDNKLMAVKRENEALWRELSVLRQKHAKQQQIVSKLLQFLVGMMSSQSHRLGFKRRMPVTLPLMLNDTDGLKSSKRNKNGGELVGPVIRDVTDFLSTGDRMLENQTDYVSGGSDIDTQPKVDSPGGSSITDRSPGGYAESAYPMSPYDDPDMLLSVDPMSMNPSVEIKSQPQITHPVQAQVQKRNNNVKKTPPKSTASRRGMGGQKKSITTSSAASFVHVPDQMTNTMITEASPVSSPDIGMGASNNQVVQNTLPTVVYLPGTETPVQVVLSLPEATTADGGGKSVGASYATVSIPTASNVLNKPTSTTTLQNVTNPYTQTTSPHSIELCIPSPKISKENSTEAAADSSTEMVLAGTDNSALSREDFDEHLDEVQSGLDNLKELLKHDQQYSLDPNTLLTLFGNEDLFDRSAISDLKKEDNIGLVPTSSGNGGDVVSYNPTLYELADDDFFDYQNNGAFLDDELESMLTTDREKLKKGDLKNNISSIS